MTTPAGAATSATSGTVAGRPQPQTTAEPVGGPFVRHAPDGRRAMYTTTTGFGGFVANPMVSSPGWNKGYRVLVNGTSGVNGTNTIAVPADSPWNLMQLVQMKDAFGTQLLTGPGYNIAYEVPLYSGQFGLDLMRAPQNSPQYSTLVTGTTPASGNFQFATYFPFEFAKGYGVISGANAALLPVLQINYAASTTVYTVAGSTTPSLTTTVDSDFYWLPNVPTDPPGIGTTCQWIFQPCNPTISASSSTVVQLPRLGGYLTMLILELRGSTGLRITEVSGSDFGWPLRPKILIDGVPLIDSLFTTMQEDLAISTGIGAGAATTLSVAGGTNAGTIPVPRPAGTIGINRKAGLSQRDLGLMDTGETFLSTNPGTQIEVAGYPWGANVANTPNTLNAIVGQVVPSGNLIQGLPEV
jgi:hypothetical protein